MKKIIVYYHGSCLDGFTGAWAAWKALGRRAEYRPLSHEIQKTPSGINGKEVYFIDFCPPRKIFDAVVSRCARVVVIDHHYTHQTICKAAHECIFSLAKSGCVLAWEYFHGTKKTPRFLHTIQDYDLFTLKKPHTLYIIAALLLARRDFLSWSRLINLFEHAEKKSAIISLGKVIKAAEEIAVDRLIEIAEPVVFHGEHAYAVNTHLLYSEVGTRIYQTLGVPLGIVWHYKRGRIKVSLRSDGSVDVGRIALRYGGGGHAAAAGFWVDFHGSFPWKIRKQKNDSGNDA